jgi:hypothetical protein
MTTASPKQNTPSEALFRLGRVLATPGALRLLDECGLGGLILLVRHQSGDWGELCNEDRLANDRAVINGERILSSYVVSNGKKIWLITEADRSVTTFLLPEEY